MADTEVRRQIQELKDFDPDALFPKSYEVSFLKKINDKENVFVKIGMAFVTEQNRIDIKLDSLPISNWNGKLTLFPVRNK